MTVNLFIQKSILLAKFSDLPIPLLQDNSEAVDLKSRLFTQIGLSLAGVFVAQFTAAQFITFAT